MLIPGVYAVLSADGLPVITKERYIDINGTAEGGSTIRFYINNDNIPEYVRNTGKFSVDAAGDGSFTGNIELSSAFFRGTQGLNEIKVEATHLDGRKESVLLTTTFDRVPPDLFVNNINSPRKSGQVEVSGTVSSDASLYYKIDNRRRTELAVVNGEFNETVNLGSDGTYNLTIIAEDAAGNVATQLYRVRVDGTPCRLDTNYEAFDELFDREQRFSIVKIKGKTEPNCNVVVVNAGEITQLNISDVLEGGRTLTQFLEAFEVSIGGLAVGRVKQVKSDSDGLFGATISLTTGILEEQTPGFPLPSEGSGVNNIHFILVDDAGNVNSEVHRLIYRPGTGSWKVSNIQTIPNTLYTDELFDENAPGYVRFSIIYDLVYFGPQNEEILNPSVSVGVTNSYDSEHISIVDVFQRWKPDEKKLIVVATAEFRANSRDVEELREKLSGNEILDLGTGLQADFEISNTVSYSYGQYSLSEESFARHAVGVETPFDYNKILKPEIIGDAIGILDDVIDVLDSAERIAQTAADVTLVGCLATTVWGWLSGPETLDTTYMVCDRIWCPTIPPDCGDFKASQIGGQKIFESAREGATTQIAFLGREKASGIIPCPVGFNAIARYTYNTTGQLGIKTPGQEIKGVGTTVTYECVPINETQWNSVTDINSLGVGCYQEGWPQHDETKCLFSDADSVNNDGEVNTYDNFFDSVQCGCISGVRGHLSNYLKVANSMKKCLQSAQLGKVSGAYCEELFLQFACDLTTSVFQEALGSDRNEFKSGEGNIARGSFDEVNSRLGARYGNIIESRYGLNSQQLVHKACVGAITGDLSGMQDVFRRVTRIPVKPIIGPMFPETRFNAWNPLTGEASISYHATLGIISGGQDIKYNFKILCDPNAEKGDYCEPGKVDVVYERAGIVLGDDSLQEKVFYVDNNARTWGNVAVLEYEYNLGNQVIRDSDRTVFRRASPFLAQCSFDAFPVFFGIRCQTLGVEGIQPIEFRSASITPTGVSHYYPQNEIWIKTETDQSLFGQGLDSVTGSAVGDEPHLYYVANITKPNGQNEFVNSRVEIGKNVQAWRLAKLAEEATGVGGPSGNYVFYGFGVDYSNFGFGRSITMDAGDFLLVEAYNEGSGGVRNDRVINEMSLDAVEGGIDDINCVKASDNRMQCTYNGQDRFTIGKMTYEVDADGSNDSINLRIVHLSRGGQTKAEVTSKKIGIPREQSKIIDRTWPAGNYKVEISLWQDIDQDGQIGVNDVSVGYGSEVIQKKTVQFSVSLEDPRAKPRECGENPRVEIINPYDNAIVDQNLKYGNEEFVEFVIWDDCMSIEKVDVYLYDSKSYDTARINVSSPQRRGVYPAWAWDYKENTFAAKHVLPIGDSSSLGFKSGYNDGERFSLIAQVVDSRNKVSDDRVNVEIEGNIVPISLADVPEPEAPSVPEVFPITGSQYYNGTKTMFSSEGIAKWVEEGRKDASLFNKWFDYSAVIDPVYRSNFVGKEFRLMSDVGRYVLYIKDKTSKLSNSYDVKGALANINILIGHRDPLLVKASPTSTDLTEGTILTETGLDLVKTRLLGKDKWIGGTKFRDSITFTDTTHTFLKDRYYRIVKLRNINYMYIYYGETNVIIVAPDFKHTAYSNGFELHTLYENGFEDETSMYAREPYSLSNMKQTAVEALSKLLDKLGARDGWHVPYYVADGLAYSSSLNLPGAKVIIGERGIEEARRQGYTEDKTGIEKFMEDNRKNFGDLFSGIESGMDTSWTLSNGRLVQLDEFPEYTEGKYLIAPLPESYEREVKDLMK